MGTIKYPVQLIGDALDNHDYENADIQSALKDSFYAILQILRRQKDHPIMEVYDDWKLATIRSHRILLKAAYDQFEHSSAFEHLFNIPLLPADRSLIQLFIVKLDLALKLHPDDKIRCHTSVLGYVLFGLVVLRVYLGRNPSDNIQIYWLARQLPEEETNKIMMDDDVPLWEAKCGRIYWPQYPEELVLLSVVKPKNGLLRPQSHFFAFTGLGMQNALGQLHLKIKTMSRDYCRL